MEKLLPHNIEAEAGVLGSLIIDPDGIDRVSDFLYAEDFYRDAHARIYEAMAQIAQHATPPDFITLCDELERRQALEDVGGASYITSLINQVPTSGNVEYYGRIVERTAILRRLIYAAGQIAAMAYESGDAEASLEKAEALLFAIAKRQHAQEAASLAQIATPYMSRLDLLHSRGAGALVGVPTGYGVLDRITGGWQKSDLVILAARPSVGKTALALNLAHYAAKHGHGVGFYSLEMGSAQLYTRLLSRETGIDSQRLRSGRINDADWGEIVLARDRLDALPLWIDDTGGLSTGALRSRARRLCTEQQIDLVIVDYLQLVQAKNEQGKRYESRVQEVTEISQRLKALAKELQVPVLALSQLSRNLESREDKHPQLSDLRDSGGLEQDADIVLMLYRDSLYHAEPTDRDGRPCPASYTELNIEKHRNGPLGDVNLYFDEVHTRFVDEAP